MSGEMVGIALPFLLPKQVGAMLRRAVAEPIRVSIESVDDADARRAATDRTPEAAILELDRIGQISSGRAARNLGIRRVESLDLASRHQIPTIQTTPDDLEEELASLEP